MTKKLSHFTCAFSHLHCRIKRSWISLRRVPFHFNSVAMKISWLVQRLISSDDGMGDFQWFDYFACWSKCDRDKEDEKSLSSVSNVALWTSPIDVEYFFERVDMVEICVRSNQSFGHQGESRSLGLLIDQSGRKIRSLSRSGQRAIRCFENSFSQIDPIRGQSIESSESFMFEQSNKSSNHFRSVVPLRFDWSESSFSEGV